ncbi:unnamed protein product [Symbiodinium sp. CCMP2592]|nr:unnamed protein product [Symbiodinium sp. CCMP2592]
MPEEIDMTASGRIYQNPANPRELWFNLGWYIKDKYQFPSYKGWMGEFISTADYNKVVQDLQDELNGSTVTQTKDQVDQGAICCCLITLCLACPVCSCVVLCYDIGLKSLKGKLTSKLENSGIKQDMRIEFVKADDFFRKASVWKDHMSQTLQLRKKGGEQFEGGPPPGCNLVITTEQPISWPPPPDAADVMADALQRGVAGATSAIQGAVAWAQSDQVQDAVKGAVDKTKDAAKAAVEWAQSDEVQDAVKGAVDKTKDAAKAAVEWAQSDEVQDAVKDAAEKTKEAAKDAAEWVQTQVKPMQQAMAFANLETYFRGLGLIPGLVLTKQETSGWTSGNEPSVPAFMRLRMKQAS